MSQPLSGRQKAVLSQLAKAAYDRAVSHFASDDLSLDEWRRREALAACGLRISEARNEHYNALKAHFENLSGRSGQAFATNLKDGTDRPRQLLHLIAQVISEAGWAPGYAVTISRSKFGRDLGGLTEPELAQLLWTLKARSAAKARRV